jgi:hypothetical protein
MPNEDGLEGLPWPDILNAAKKGQLIKLSSAIGKKHFVMFFVLEGLAISLMSMVPSFRKGFLDFIAGPCGPDIGGLLAFSALISAAYLYAGHKVGEWEKVVNNRLKHEKKDPLGLKK